MSVPARKIQAPASQVDRRGSRTRKPATPHRSSRRSARPKRSVVFWGMSLALVGFMALSLTVMSTLVAQSAFRLQQLTTQQAQLMQENGQLRLQVADLSAPQRVSAWAAKNGLILPAFHQIIHLPAQGSRASNPPPVGSTITQTIAAGGSG